MLFCVINLCVILSHHQDGPNAIDGDDGPMTLEDIDTSNGVMYIFYDPDTNVVYLAGKVNHGYSYTPSPSLVLAAK